MITSTDTAVFHWIEANLPQIRGSVYLALKNRCKDGYKRKPLYNWVIGKTSSVWMALSLMAPYVVVKKDLVNHAIKEIFESGNFGYTNSKVKRKRAHVEQRSTL